MILILTLFIFLLVVSVSAASLVTALWLVLWRDGDNRNGRRERDAGFHELGRVLPDARHLIPRVGVEAR